MLACRRRSSAFTCADPRCHAALFVSRSLCMHLHLQAWSPHALRAVCGLRDRGPVAVARCAVSDGVGIPHGLCQCLRAGDALTISDGVAICIEDEDQDCHSKHDRHPHLDCQPDAHADIHPQCQCDTIVQPVAVGDPHLLADCHTERHHNKVHLLFRQPHTVIVPLVERDTIVHAERDTN